MAHVIATIILVSFLPFSTPAPNWVLYLYGFAVFTYQMMDNLDGKQARKIGNSTPLGMLMDHGCDALGVIFLTAGVARTILVDNHNIILWVYFSLVFSFYFSAWCQNHSKGVMILGYVNGVDDGIAAIWMIAFVTPLIGAESWLTPISFLGGLPINETLAYAIISFSFSNQF
jgi:ethanolaminephosphotransferase